MLHFKNDYSESAHPRVMEAVAALGAESNIGYGADPYCQRAADLIRALCAASEAAVHFFVGGTAANLAAITAFLRPWEAVISPATGHINVHEGGGVEASGHKILPVTSSNGKLRPSDIDTLLALHTDNAMVLPRLVYLSNATEVGTIYTKEELIALRACCRRHGLCLFLDGARLGSGLTAQGSDLTLPDLAALTDAFYIGGTKNGALMGEAMVISNRDLQPYFFRTMKQRGAVLAKGFLLGVQFEALLKDGLYWELARHANSMAQRLQAGLEAKGYPMMLPSPTNQVFPVLPNSLLPRLDEICSYEIWEKGEEHSIVRLVTSFNTREENVDALLCAL